ncbi:MAG: hypothetical protein LBR36_08200 [Bacteroidales bacterium]|jgi:hypothetical protein|nr:hypothetical protein [Bacteroidales bacterium]
MLSTTRDSLINTLGMPENENTLKMNVVDSIRGGTIYYHLDTITIKILGYFSKGLQYIEFEGKVQLSMIDFYKNDKVKICNSKICYDKQLILNDLLHVYNDYPKEEIRKRKYPRLYGYEEWGYDVWLPIGKYENMELNFDKHKKLRCIHFSYDNGGILSKNN